jgi:hypothetical protein
MFLPYISSKILGFLSKGPKRTFKNIEFLPKGTRFREGDKQIGGVGGQRSEVSEESTRAAVAPTGSCPSVQSSLSPYVLFSVFKELALKYLAWFHAILA